MRSLGFLFLAILVVAGIGYFRGWFAVTTTQAADRNKLTVGIDSGKMGDDAKAAVDHVELLSQQAADHVRALGRKAGPDESEIEGTLTGIDQAARNLTLGVGEKSIVMHVGAAVAISGNGSSSVFADLRSGMRVRCSFQAAGETQRLTRIMVLP